MSDMNSHWVERPIRLTFRVGEAPVGSLSFPALVLDRSFLRILDDGPGPILPPDVFPLGIEAIKIASCPVEEILPRLTILPRTIRYVPSQYRRYYIDMAGTFNQYINKFSSKSRSALRKKVRKFAEFSGGEVRWRIYRRPEELDEFHRLARDVSAKTYQERLLQCGLPDDDGFRAASAELAARNALRSSILFHGEQPIAFLHCPMRDECLLYEHVGYDPEYANWSPGTVLLYLTLEALFAEGCFRTFDFTEGEGVHKESFANRSAFCADIYYFRKTARHRLILGVHGNLLTASNTTVSLLDRVGLKRRLKKLIRSWS